MILKRGPRVKNAQKTKVDDHTFDSKMEALRYIELKRLKQAGIVTEIELQPGYSLLPTYWKCCKTIFGSLELKKGKCPYCGKKVPATRGIQYHADFRVTYADRRVEIEDVKGMETEIFRRNQKEFEYKYPEHTLKLVKGVHR